MRILVVEDEPEFRRLLARALAARGHQIEVAGSAFGIVNRVAGVVEGGLQPAPDLVLLDHMLPGLAGGSALALLARDRRTRAVPVILMSNIDPTQLGALAEHHPRCRVYSKSDRLSALLALVDDTAGSAAQIAAPAVIKSKT